jgi:hypothetical protein
MKPKCRMFSHAALLLVVFLPCFGQRQPKDSPPKFSATVQLSITCDDALLKSQITSYLSRELRSLGDITIVDERPDFMIAAIAMTLTPENESDKGFVIAIRTTKPERSEWWTAKWLKDFLGVERVSEAKLGLLKQLHQTDEHNVQFTLVKGSLDGLQRQCKQVIANFDTEVLESEHKLWNLIYKQ